MTDTRLPSRWLLDMTFEGLSDRAYRTFCQSLMWSNEQGTDGAVPRAAMKYLHPHGVDEATRRELIEARLWSGDQAGIIVRNWTATQSTAADLEAKRAASRDRQQKHRDRKKSDPPPVTRDVTRDATRDVTSDVPSDVREESREEADKPRYVTRDVTRESLGKDRTGQERTGKEYSEAENHASQPIFDWDTVQPGSVKSPNFHDDDDSDKPF